MIRLLRSLGLACPFTHRLSFPFWALPLLLVGMMVCLSGCGRVQLWVYQTNKSQMAQALWHYVNNNDFHLAYADDRQGVYRIDLKHELAPLSQILGSASPSKVLVFQDHLSAYPQGTIQPTSMPTQNYVHLTLHQLGHDVVVHPDCHWGMPTKNKLCKHKRLKDFKRFLVRQGFKVKVMNLPG